MENEEKKATNIPVSAEITSDNQVPTFFCHGFRGGDYTTKKLVGAALKKTGKTDFLRVTVNWRGRLSYEGIWTGDDCPIVQIVFKDKWVGGRVMAYWIFKVIRELTSYFNFEYYNSVGHSLGAVALVLMEIKKSKYKLLPKLRKLMLIAGPFDGVIGLGDLPNLNQVNDKGRPLFMSPTYVQLLLTADKFPKDVEVLNVYGNLNDFSNTDQYVSVISAKSIDYILKDRVKSFNQVEVVGKNGEHSQMHDDEDILRLMTDFIYNDQDTKSTEKYEVNNT